MYMSGFWDVQYMNGIELGVNLRNTCPSGFCFVLKLKGESSFLSYLLNPVT